MALTLLIRSVSEDESQRRFPYFPRSRCGLLDQSECHWADAVPLRNISLLTASGFDLP